MDNITEKIEALKEIRILRDSSLKNNISIINTDKFSVGNLSNRYKLIIYVTSIFNTKEEKVDLQILKACKNWVVDNNRSTIIELFDRSYFLVDHGESFLFTPKSQRLNVDEEKKFREDAKIIDPLSQLMILSCHDALARQYFYKPFDIIKYSPSYSSEYYRVVTHVNPAKLKENLCYYFD